MYRIGVAQLINMGHYQVEQVQAATHKIEGLTDSEYKKNKYLNAKANGIRTISADDDIESKRRGGPLGQLVTKNKPKDIDRIEIVDVEECPHNKNHELSEKITDEYSRTLFPNYPHTPTWP